MEQSKTISAPQSRIHVLDALRGFALLGVILMHMLQHFGVFSGAPASEPQFPILDTAIQWLSQHVIMGKFINIFAFLFGLSFFIQMDRGAKKVSISENVLSGAWLSFCDRYRWKQFFHSRYFTYICCIWSYHGTAVPS